MSYADEDDVKKYLQQVLNSVGGQNIIRPTSKDPKQSKEAEAVSASSYFGSTGGNGSSALAESLEQTKKLLNEGREQFTTKVVDIDHIPDMDSEQSAIIVWNEKLDYVSWGLETITAHIVRIEHGGVSYIPFEGEYDIEVDIDIQHNQLVPAAIDFDHTAKKITVRFE